MGEYCKLTQIVQLTNHRTSQLLDYRTIHLVNHLQPLQRQPLIYHIHRLRLRRNQVDHLARANHARNYYLRYLGRNCSIANSTMVRVTNKLLFSYNSKSVCSASLTVMRPE